MTKKGEAAFCIVFGLFIGAIGVMIGTTLRAEDAATAAKKDMVDAVRSRDIALMEIDRLQTDLVFNGIIVLMDRRYACTALSAKPER